MADGPRYRVPFRRRREGKTNYHRRLKLIRSLRNRVIIRTSNMHTIVQVAESLMHGDQILAEAHSTQLNKNYGWVFNTSNLPSAYLTGYLCGLRAKNAGIDEAILDVGILVHDNRLKAALQGMIDAGIDVPHDENWFQENLFERMKGQHIQNYAEKLAKDDKKLYKKFFSSTLDKNGDPTKIVKTWENIKTKMDKKV